MTNIHKPVLLNQAIDWLDVKPKQWYIDATFGRGGHTHAILAKGGFVIALDIDDEAISWGKQHFAKQIENGQFILINCNFEDISNQVWPILNKLDQRSIAGCLFDFGTSTPQLTSTSRGFSFQGDGPLDMRMDKNLGVTAADLLQVLGEKQLIQVLREFGGEHHATSIAKAIVKQRQKQPITTTTQLSTLISNLLPKRGHLHPATKTFQALRIAVNRELDVIQPGLQGAFALLAGGGRIVTIAFHEGEDRIAKQLFRDWENRGLGKKLTKKPITADADETETNPNSRSAKLRVFVKAN